MPRVHLAYAITVALKQFVHVQQAGSGVYICAVVLKLDVFYEVRSKIFSKSFQDAQFMALDVKLEKVDSGKLFRANVCVETERRHCNFLNAAVLSVEVLASVNRRRVVIAAAEHRR